MARGLKKHLKRLNALKHWMLDKLGGAFAPKPSPSPHKWRECLPLVVLLRNRLKYSLTYREVITIVMQRLICVDGKVRTDKCYPAGFMDVVSIAKTNENLEYPLRENAEHLNGNTGKTAIQRIAEKLRSLGYVDEVTKTGQIGGSLCFSAGLGMKCVSNKSIPSAFPFQIVCPSTDLLKVLKTSGLPYVDRCPHIASTEF